MRSLLVPLLTVMSMAQTCPGSSYTVVAGDSCFTISQTLMVDFNALLNLNSICNSPLQVGDLICIPSTSSSSSMMPPTSSSIPSTSSISSISSGIESIGVTSSAFKSLPGNTKGSTASGALKIVTSTTEGTYVELQVASLANSNGTPYIGSFISHIHAGTCNNGSATPYANDATLPPLTEANEIWIYGNALNSTSNLNGKVYSAAAPFSLPQNVPMHYNIHKSSSTTGAPSIIPPGSPWFCVDFTLTSTEIVSVSTFINQLGDSSTILANLAIFSGVNPVIPMTAAILDITVSSFANQYIMSHIHALPCSSGAGGHYKFNTSKITVDEMNEVWFHLILDGTGKGHVGNGRNMNIQNLTNAASIVLHDPLTKVPVLCADLTWNDLTSNSAALSYLKSVLPIVSNLPSSTTQGGNLPPLNQLTSQGGFSNVHQVSFLLLITITLVLSMSLIM